MSTAITVVNFTGFETGDDYEAFDGTGTYTFDATTKRTGGYSMKLVYDGTNNIYYTMRKHDAATGDLGGEMNTATTYVTFYLYISSAPTLNPESICLLRTNFPKIKADLRLTTARKLNLYDNLGVDLRGTGTTVLNTGQWYRIDLKIGSESIGTANDAPYELKIDGVSEYSGTNGNMQVEATAEVILGCITVHNAATFTLFFDDWSVASNAFVGSSKISMPVPNASGSYAGWTGDYTAVDETPVDVADYVSTATTGAQESIVSTSLSTYGLNASSTIHAMKGIAVTRRIGAIASGLKYFTFVNATEDSTSTATDPTTGWACRGKVDNLDFSISDDWTYDAANAYEVGVTQGGSRTCQCAFLRTMVLWTPGASSKWTPHAGL